MDSDNLKDLVEKLESEIKSFKTKLNDLQYENKALQTSNKKYLKEQDDLKKQIEETKLKYQRIKALQEGKYEEVVSDVFGKPVKEISDQILKSSKTSTSTTFKWAIAGIIATTLLSVLLNKFSSNQLDESIEDIKTVVNLYGKDEINKDNVSFIKSTISKCEKDKKLETEKVEDSIEDYYRNCIEPNLELKEIPINYVEIYIGFDELGYEYKLPEIREELRRLDLERVHNYVKRFKEEIPYDSLDNHPQFIRLKQRVIRNYPDSNVVQSRAFNKLYRDAYDKHFLGVGEIEQRMKNEKTTDNE